MRYRFADGALAEFIETGRYYNRQASGLGDEFVDAIEDAIDTILKDPLVWRFIEDDVRRYLVRRFPYGIYYTIENDVVVIWAVQNLHRHPDYWRTRRL
jgi:toxin ParE1/3/4